MWKKKRLDGEKSLFNFPLDLVRGVPAGERRAVKLPNAKNESGSPRIEKSLSRLAPSGIRVVIFVSRAFRSKDVVCKSTCKLAFIWTKQTNPYNQGYVYVGQDQAICTNKDIYFVKL